MNRKEQITLSAYIRKIMDEKGLSAREVSRRSTLGGNEGFSNTWISKLVDSGDQNVTVKTLQSLAAALGEPEDDVFDAARGKPLDLGDEHRRVIGRASDIFQGLTGTPREQFVFMVESFSSYLGDDERGDLSDNG